jgi:DNA-binding Lrp family transcriptional regulator
MDVVVMKPVERGTEESGMMSRSLDAMLGSQANVKLLRILTTGTPGPMNAEEAARRTGLTPPGARKGLERLVGTGLVRRAGAGPQKQFSLNSEHPLVGALGELFEAEARCYHDLLKRLRTSLGAVPEIRAAWIVGPSPEPGESIHVALVAEPADLPWIGAEARQRVTEVERDFDLIIEIDTYTEVDAPVPDVAASIPLAGIVPGPATRVTGRPITHDELDRRSLDTAVGIAQLIRDDPSIIARAKRHLDDLLQAGQGTATGDLAEWRLLLDTYSAQSLQQFLVSSSSRAQRLRSSSPFLPVLSPEERARLFACLERPR